MVVFLIEKEITCMVKMFDQEILMFIHSFLEFQVDFY